MVLVLMPQELCAAATPSCPWTDCRVRKKTCLLLLLPFVAEMSLLQTKAPQARMKTFKLWTRRKLELNTLKSGA